MKKISFLVLFLFGFTTFAAAQAREAMEIKITSAWGGLGASQKSELLIARKGDEYFAKGGKIETEKIEAFLSAVDAPEIKEFRASNLGITQDWLNANAAAGVDEYAGYYFSTGAPNQKELYFSTFKNLASMEKLLPRVLSGGWTDDYPRVAIEITETDGSKTIVSSDEQPLFMLPWKIEKNGRSAQTYNADISRCLVALLPKKFANKERLSGEGLRRILAQSVMSEIKKDWERLESENKAGDALNVLKKDYEIVSAEINPYHGVDFGESWDKNKNPQKNLHLILRKNDFPKNFAVRLKLPFVNERVENLEAFQKNVGKYRDLIFSIAWLKDYIENGKTPVELRFITDRSFSEKAMKKFAEDMNKIGKNDLAAEVEKSRNDSALIGVGGGLEYYQSYWIVLPDKRVILWRYRYRNLMNWKEENFQAKECTDEISAGLKCVGAVVSADGSLVAD